MQKVIIGLIPGILLMTLNFGIGVLFQLLLCALAALLIEGLAISWRGRSVALTLNDRSAVVCALLLALSVPPSAPWWLAVTGTALALLLGKHAYGGLGQNPFNPAMLGYALVLIAFPREMTLWPAPLGTLPEGVSSFQESLLAYWGGSPTAIDAITQATPLNLRHESWVGHTPKDTHLPVTTARWILINLAFLLGGLYLGYQRVIDPRIPSGVLLGMLSGITLDLGFFSESEVASPYLDLLLGASLMGAFFIATDPVSAAVTPLGKWIYGVGIGILVILIRHHGGYPDGFAFAVLLMNFAAPTLDRYTHPRIFGRRFSRQGD